MFGEASPEYLGGIVDQPLIIGVIEFFCARCPKHFRSVIGAFRRRLPVTMSADMWIIILGPSPVYPWAFYSDLEPGASPAR